ncbi:MAG: proline dehydrogenase family protein [Planctomycetota bacterium]
MNPLIRLIPPFLVRVFARPYVAGDSLEHALKAADELWRNRGILSSLDLLAEGIETDAAAAANRDTYLEMVQAAGTDPRFSHGNRPSLSLKASNFTSSSLHEGGDGRGAADAIRQICVAAAEQGVDLTLDMESRHWTDYTLDLLRDLHAEGHKHIGAVLQTRLNRCEADLDRLPEGIRVRLVIGIYAEPEDCAISDKPEMKERMLRYAQILLERGHYVEFATHDETYVRRFVSEVLPASGARADRCELQLIYGVPRRKLLAEMREGQIRCRVYIPFALSWPMAVAYLRRRLDEYPAMMWMVAKNMLRRG